MADRNRHLEIPVEQRRDHARELIAKEVEQVQEYWALTDDDLAEVLGELHYAYAGGCWATDEYECDDQGNTREGGAA